MRFKWVFLGASLVVATMIGCRATNPHYDSGKSHHTAKGFKNNYAGAGGKPLSELISWQWNAFRQGLPKPPSQVVSGYQFPLQKPNMAALQEAKTNPSKVTVTFIGHATTLVQSGGLTILTDPHFTERASPVSFAGPKRRTPVAAGLKELPRIDVVVISHNHYDHLDIGTVKQLMAQAGGEPLFLVPLGIDIWLKEQGAARVVGLDWWAKHVVDNTEFVLTPVQHWSSRSMGDQNSTLWGGWAVKRPDFQWFFAGDTGYSKDFKDITARFGTFDLALIPIGAYEPRWFMKDQHVNPTEAVQIHQDLGSKLSIGVHWGTFELTDEALDQPLVDLPKALAAAGVSADKFIALGHGETKVLR